MFRNGSQDERLDKKTRLHLLELIELRAKLWQGSDYMSQYYKHRGTHAEVWPNKLYSKKLSKSKMIRPLKYQTTASIP